jgi:membrane-bound metal-dependent hydrolase YbcI (DUF457 family)
MQALSVSDLNPRSGTMVDVMGHVAMGLLWATPAWFLWRRRVAFVFVGTAAVAALLPDADLWIEKVTPSLIHHHGFTHTVVFVVALSLVMGGLVAAAQTRPLGRWLRSERFRTRGLVTFTMAAFFLGGLSHVFADILSAPDIASPIEPFWPVYNEPVILDWIWYNDPVWNLGLLAATVMLHLFLAVIVEPFDHSYRIIDV